MKKRLMSFQETQVLLNTFQIAQPPQILVEDMAQAIAAAESVGYPLVLKLVSSAATHKSDANLVVLNIQDRHELLAQFELLRQRGAHLPDEGFLLQHMLKGGVETLAGTIWDAQFGHAIVFGTGGTLVEWLNDTSLRIPPLNEWQIEQMVSETRVASLLDGYRGQPACDRSALVECLSSLARLVQTEGTRLLSMDINPLIVMPRGAFAVDTRIYVREEE